MLCLSLITNVCCTTMVSVPPSEYSRLDSDAAEVWRVKTTDKEVFVVNDFIMTDSTMVIRGLDYRGENKMRLLQPVPETSITLPISISRDRILSLEKQKTEYAEPALIIGIPALILAGVIAVAATVPRGGV